ncbi:hypothetical protein [Streptomyces coeruleorubidus]|uniref:hypothetical protein n=1 Tax=Streptomyces coeruleorubidus TaxID=116188 RepID=UPI0033F1E01B
MRGLGLPELRGFGKVLFCAAWMSCLLGTAGLAVSYLPGWREWAQVFAVLLTVALGPVCLVAGVRAVVSRAGHNLLGVGNGDAFVWWCLWCLPRGVQAGYLGAGSVMILGWVTGRAEPAGVIGLALFTSLMALMTASAAETVEDR